MTRCRLELADYVRRGDRPKALATHLLLPLAYTPERHALAAADHFLRFSPRSPMAPVAYRRAVALARGLPVSGEPVTLARSIILKAPDHGARERGVLLTSFEPELAKLARYARLPDITASYDIAFLATWHPFYSMPLYQYVARAPRRMFLMPSSASDYELCRHRHEDVVAFPFQSSSWVNPDFYAPPPRKDIDIIMVANFSRYKRHWHLFRALRDLPRRLRVVLVGIRIDNRTKETLLEEATAFGVADRLEIHEGPPDEVVSDLLSRAKIFLALSAKEGSYISIAESLFSGTPVGVYRDAVIGSKDYINEHTGTLLDSREPLAPQIESFLDRAKSYSPQAWAIANISARVNGARLNELLRAQATNDGGPWSRDIAPFYCRHFDFFYERADDEAAFSPIYGRFERDYGVRIVRRP